MLPHPDQVRDDEPARQPKKAKRGKTAKKPKPPADDPAAEE